MLSPLFVCSRRQRSSLFLTVLAAVSFICHVVLAEEPRQSAEDDPFDGLVLGQQELVALKATERYESRSLPMPSPPRSAANLAPTTGSSLFSLTRKLEKSPSSGSSSLERSEGQKTSERLTSQASPRSISSEPADNLRSERAERTAVIDIPPQIDLVELNAVDVVIDGRLDEDAWSRVAGFENMVVVEPDTLVDPEYRTLVRIFYTDRGLFVSAEMEQPTETLIQRLSARDQDLNRDGFGITLDTSGKGLFGFWFAINLGGSKEDGKVLPERNFSREWDGAWHGATAITDTGWSAELFIPWSIVAMPPGGGERKMSFFVNRKVAFQNERYGWPALPFTQARFMSALQAMVMNDVNPKQQWEVFPYASTSADGIYEETDQKVGMNFSWRPAPNLQLTGAVNPDFGSVESDDVVVNLTAYETFFPEKRLFFLEGSEVFETSPRSTPMRGSRGGGARVAPLTYTVEPTTVLNTRRIGGSAKDLDVPDGIEIAGPELSKPTDLLGAVKVVGQANSFRFGLLGAVEEDVELRGTVEDTEEDILITQTGRDFGVARALWERQTGSGRQAHGYIGTIANTPGYEAMVHGFDSHFLTQNGKWNVDTQLLSSVKDSETGYGGFADVRYIPKQGVFHRFSFDFLGDKLDISDLGFLRRNDVRGVRYTRFHNTSKGLPDFLRSRGIGVFSSAQANSNGDLIRAYIGTNLAFYFTNQSALDVQFAYRPSAVDDRSSFDNGSFETEATKFVMFTFGTDTAKKLSYSVQAGFRDDELGDPAYIGDVGVTYSPINRLRLDYDLRYRDSKGWLIWVGDGDFTRYFSEQLSHIVSLDFFMTARQQFRATLQWTGVNATERDFWQVPNEIGKLVPRSMKPGADSDDFTISRLTAQLRYRWEIAPLSDLFVVYTRGSNVPSLGYAEFNTLFREALQDPIVDIIVLKLRYRFGS